MVLLTDRNKIEAALGHVLARLQAGTETYKRRLSIWSDKPGPETVWWHPQHRFWSAWRGQFPSAHGERYLLAFGVGDPTCSTVLSVAVEINPPTEGHDRNAAGRFVADGDAVYLAHSGKLGGGKLGIGREAFLASYPYDNLETVIWPGGRESRDIVIGRVDRVRLAAHLALYVHAVEAFRKPAQSDGRPTAPHDAAAQFTPEFAGMRQSYLVPEAIESRCDHGLVVNALSDQLAGRGLHVANDAQRDLQVLRSDGSTRILFEAKTDLNRYSLYAAIGQLMLHGAYQTPSPRRVLVVPGEPDTPTREALRQIGIEVLRYRLQSMKAAFDNLDGLLSQDGVVGE